MCKQSAVIPPLNLISPPKNHPHRYRRITRKLRAATTQKLDERDAGYDECWRSFQPT
jgi:hypothetical protein